MSKSYVTGFPRIGEQRELKHALEAYWSGNAAFNEVQRTSLMLRKRHWECQKQAGIDLISCNDFSFYDNMLDTVVMLGAIPERFHDIEDETKRYFAMARGDEKRSAMAMTKWFNTNYHYIVPELSKKTRFSLNAKKLFLELAEAQEYNKEVKVNLIGPITFLALSSSVDGSDVFAHFDAVLACYVELFHALSAQHESLYIQMDEPFFVTDVTAAHLTLLKRAYETLCQAAPNVKITVMTYFDHASEAVKVLAQTPVWGIGLDLVHGVENMAVLELLGDKQLIAGVVDGRNIWRNDIDATLSLLERVAQSVPKERISIAPSCSLLHVPYTLKYEETLDPELKSWLSFACEKLDEIALISAFFHNKKLTEAQRAALESNAKALESRRNSQRVHDERVRQRMASLEQLERKGDYATRIGIQKAALEYPTLATTTIGSFPQTPELRALRRDYKKGTIDTEVYNNGIKAYIDECIAFQESIGLDVLVHGEPERNDMVEYFGEQLQGYAFTKNGWVQSYGSRCVKPPLLFGDISRPQPMTLFWSHYAQSKTDRIMKGMLTGPVTILNWSFVRDDMPRSDVAAQIALAICDEVADLQKAGIRMIQVDEAAFKEGYPLRKSKISAYEKWALACFKLAVSSAKMETQIHTHMCYSDFNDIIKTIEAMDADVISIETARAGNKLLRIFKEVGYAQEVGPGVYDIHSPRIPGVKEMEEQIHALLEVLPKEQLWINPDCGLKTRKWEEVKPSLANMVEAVRKVRASF